MPFSIDIKPQSIGASASVNGAGVDMQGWDGVLFLLALGVIDGTQDMKIQAAEDTAFSGGDLEDPITGAAITQLTGTDDNKGAIVDVWRPTQRYVRSVVSNGAGAAADFQCVIAVCYRATGRLPITQHADILELIKVAQN
jgi:hypothetical protein